MKTLISFCAEWDAGYYRVPQPHEEQREDAPVDTAALAAMLIPGRRVKMPPPDSGSDDRHPQHGERATVTMRMKKKGE